MSNALSQDLRPAKLTTPLGEDVLGLTRFEGNEALSELFEFRVEAVSDQQNLDFKPALGKNCSLQVATPDGKDRFFNGVLAEARWAGARDTLYVYQLVLRPWLWLLTLTSDCRIFANMSALDIVQKVFSDRGFTDFRQETKAAYPKLEYCVQYRETDFDFVSRLMEEYGIYYFFECTKDAHTLVLADMKASHKAVAELASVPYVPVADNAARGWQHLQDWSRGRSVESGAFKLNDYDYNKPSVGLLVDSQKPGGYAHDSMEMYDYPGRYVDRGVGTTLAQVEAEAAQSLDDRRTATGSALSLSPGGLVTLTGHPVGSENQEYLVVGCSHFFQSQSYRSGQGDDGPTYLGNFEFTPSSRQFRAELDTERPYIAGVQSALVVGKQGEEIDVDEQGRIRVQFYWDRKKTASRWVRVAQPWAGGNRRGFLFIPRIGDEVLVQYDDGDPDRPIVTGSVYNGGEKTLWDLPGRKNVSGIRSDSTKGHSGHNGIGFDDTAGAEAMYFRAQKDFVTRTLNDETCNVGFDENDAPAGDGNFILNALKTATINIGPKGSPLTQIVMDTKSITLNVGPSGTPTQIVMNATGITLASPTITLNGNAIVSASAPMVKINS